MKILGIETSCDETAASVVVDGTKILSNVVASQINLHASYGGVVPEIAARSHIESILPVMRAALMEAGLPIPTSRTADLLSDIDAIAVTHTPGLGGSLLIGTLTARTLALTNNIPLYPTHHLKSHIYANWLDKPDADQPDFPLIALVISGGHTQIIHMPGPNTFEIIGTTLDDAVGEAFDKAAKILGFPYPGGPSIAAAATKATDPTALPYRLPVPKVGSLDFSFSGLKTALLRAVQKAAGVPISTPSHTLAALLTDSQRNNFAASFQSTSIKILTEKLEQAVRQYSPKSIVLGGGVSANRELQSAFSKRFDNLYFPELRFCGDNAAMVASAAYFSIKSGQKPSDPLTLDISPHSSIH